MAAHRVARRNDPGDCVVRAFPFAFDTPDLLTGATLYTPPVGDVLLDAWIKVTTAWDGTTPLCDLITTADTGLFYDAYQAIDLSLADGSHSAAGVLNSAHGANDNKNYALSMGNVSVPAGVASRRRVVPAEFSAANPLKVVVSQDGTNTGADPGATQGAAVLYLVTSTPRT